MRSIFPFTLAIGLLLPLDVAAAISDGGDSGHHPGKIQRPIDSSHDRSRPGPDGRDRFNRFDTFHNILVSPRRYHASIYRKPSGWYYRLWGIGDVLPSLFIAQGYLIDNYREY